MTADAPRLDPQARPDLMNRGADVGLPANQEGELTTTDTAKGPVPFSERWRNFRRAFQQFCYGMTLHEMTVETRHARADLDHLFMLIVFGDLIGLPVLPPYYSLRLLPHIMPALQRWKRSVLRERDLTDLARVDL